jgi:hypothetical protein
VARITESFNTADSSTLGPDLSWTEIEGDLAIVSNKAQGGTGVSSTGFWTRADSDLATINQYAQVTGDTNDDNGTNGFNYTGVMVRKDATATITCYAAQLRWQENQVTIDKFIDGDQTILATAAVTLTPGTPVTIRLEVRGTALRVYTNGVFRASATDSDISAGTRTGLFGFVFHSSDLITFENFEAGDLPPLFRRPMAGGHLGLDGGSL